jgi:glycosyltransferase involved in cell wall biosynthesis
MSAAKPFFSIVIPLYNKQEHIANTVLSVLHQTFTDFELLVINDGSTDESVTLVKMFTDYRLRLYHQKNAGVSAARNTGINRSRGQYIAFLDADDLWQPDYLAEMHKLIIKYPGCGLYSAAHTVLQTSRSFVEGATMPEGIVKDYFRNELMHHITRLSATIINPVILKKIKGFPVGMISGEDSFFCASIARNFPVAYTPKPLVTYNKKFTGLSQRFDKVDNCKECWIELYSDNDYYCNELIAVKAIRAGIRNVLNHNKLKSKKIESEFSYTKFAKKQWRILFLLNRMPLPWMKLVLQFITMKKLITGFYYVFTKKKHISIKLQPHYLKQSYSQLRVTKEIARV